MAFAVCHATRQLHIKNGTIHRHGPRNSPCPGSDKFPLHGSSSMENPSDTDSIHTLNVNPVSSGEPPFTFSGLNSTRANGQSNNKPIPLWTPVTNGLIKHIPKSARVSCVGNLSGLLRNVTNNPTLVNNWILIFKWAEQVLAAPKRTGKKHNLVSSIKKRLASFPVNIIEKSVDFRRKPAARSPAQQLSKSVSSKLEDGNLKAAIRLLISEDTISSPNENGFHLLQEKHPPATLDLDELQTPEKENCFSVTESIIRKAVMSFPAGSSGGPDGFSPQHLKDLVCCREAGSDLVTALTGFVNMCLSGRCPQEVSKIFFGGRLISLTKKSGGIRPIAIGFTLRRLVSKVANNHGITNLSGYFYPRQLGVGTSGGCEAAVHASRRYLENMPRDKIMVKLDFSNAFNSLRRLDMIQAVKDRLPDLYPYVYSAYAVPSNLYYGHFTLLSNEGPQQGDPIGPLLFSNAIHPMLDSMESELTIGYLDDLTLADTQLVVERDVQRVIDVGICLGLHLNVSKCELITSQDTTISSTLLKSFKRLTTGESDLLGAPLFQGACLDAEWEKRCEDMSRASERLATLNSQDALILLRASFGAPRVQHLLRCSPSVGHLNLVKFDKIQRASLTKISNSDISDMQWLQASLPIKEGGLGVKRVASLALPAFLASAASTTLHQDAILVKCNLPSDTFTDACQTDWASRYGPLPESSVSFKQSTWNKPIVAADKGLVEINLRDPRDKAIFLAATTKHSGDWLSALPISACGLRLEDEAVRIGVALRLGLNVCVPHDCKCGESVDAWGLHAMICKKASGRITRHQALNDIIARAFNSAGIPVMKEPTGLSFQNGKRSDGLTHVPWQTRKALVWDITVLSTLACSYLVASSQTSGAAAELASAKKINKYADISAAYRLSSNQLL